MRGAISRRRAAPRPIASPSGTGAVGRNWVRAASHDNRGVRKTTLPPVQFMKPRVTLLQPLLVCAVALGLGSSPSLPAAFTDANWTALGSGVSNTVYAVAVSGSGVYAGGDFTTAGGSPANRIAKWNAGGWAGLTLGMNSDVSALAVSGSDLYAGGFFITPRDSPANYLAQWNGRGWPALGSGLGG